MIAEKSVGYTKFFLVRKKTIIEEKTTINLIRISTSDKDPDGKIKILAIKAARVE